MSRRPDDERRAPSAPRREGEHGRTRLSVIITHEPGTDLRRCLDSLCRQIDRDTVEVIVAHADSFRDPELERDFGSCVQFVRASAEAGIPGLRFAGVARASGEVIAITEAAAEFPASWSETLLRAHEGEFDAVGGCIDPAPHLDAVSLAAHICEYGPYTGVTQHAADADFSGFHSSYRREVWERCPEPIRRCHWETVVHPELRRRGARFCLQADLCVRNTRKYTVRKFLAQRLRYGRDYGRIRTARISRAAHIALLGLTAGLPVVLLYRYVVWTLRAGLGLRRALMMMPWLLLFASAWSLGEWQGYVIGLSRQRREP